MVIRLADAESRLKVTNGVKQGSALSPFLFALVMDFELAEAGGDHVMFADDTVLMAEGLAEFQELMERWNDKQEESGLKLNVQKQMDEGL